MVPDLSQLCSSKRQADGNVPSETTAAKHPCGSPIPREDSTEAQSQPHKTAALDSGDYLDTGSNHSFADQENINPANKGQPADPVSNDWSADPVDSSPPADPPDDNQSETPVGISPPADPVDNDQQADPPNNNQPPPTTPNPLSGLNLDELAHMACLPKLQWSMAFIQAI
ncbi:hypothetical protein F5J12DRAFT_783343 [Pisolithus orientalis]|uniref:uncharacterized protein n=1 Tax=Pisolithus orientalis TaxID=936130 RepID=UPI0022240CBB|nr:uncharacterized protein F5J12DRAFT_783343 [Pisolithus orientalis]KAI6004345.1 hypothetical protein F5J12DRAFT_783343 [Pisolithus orientalis]